MRLSGKIGRRTDAELLEAFAARVPGVVSVHSTLRWAWDDEKPEKDDARVPSSAGGL